jgi:putative hemolysin
MKSSSLIIGMFALLGVSQAHAEPSVGIPNPAATYCVSLGGKLEAMKDATGGEFALCTFGKAQIEEWTLFRNKLSRLPQMAAASFCKSHNSPASEIAHPDKLFCEQQGGTVEVAEAPQGRKIGLCHFSDNSTIELQTLFLGAQYEANLSLNKVLGCN